MSPPKSAKAIAARTQRLHQAFWMNRPDQAQQALRDGADPYAPMACRGGQILPLNYLMAYSLVDSLRTTTQTTALMQVLLTHGTDPQRPDAFYGTPLAQAVQLARPEWVALLMEHGARWTEGSDATPFETLGGLDQTLVAREAQPAQRYRAVAQQLLEAGADPLARNAQGLRAWQTSLAHPHALRFQAILSVSPLTPEEGPDVLVALQRLFTHAYLANQVLEQDVIQMMDALAPTLQQWVEQEDTARATLQTFGQQAQGWLMARLAPQTNEGLPEGWEPVFARLRGWVLDGALNDTPTCKGRKVRL